MKHTLLLPAALAAICLLIASCGLFKTPGSTNIGYQINNASDSQPTIQIGSNGAQANGLYGQLPPGGAPNDKPLFWNDVENANRSTDADVTAALQRDTQASGQTQARDQSPQTTTQTPTVTQTTDKHVNVPVSIGQSAESGSQTAEGAAPADKKD